MTNNAQDTNNGNNGNDGFVWSQRLTVIAGTVIALVAAAAAFAPVLAGGIGSFGH